MTTRHSIKRVKQRMGYKGKTAARVIENAYVRGISDASAGTPLLRHYLQGTAAADGYSAHLYQGFCFIFAGNACITVLPQPRWLARECAEKRHGKAVSCGAKAGRDRQDEGGDWLPA